MPSLNKTIQIGHATRDCELKYTQGGTAIATFGIANSEHWKDAQGNKKEKALFIDVTVMGKFAEIVQKFVHKGSLLYVEGILQLDTWDDKTTGKKCYKHSIKAEKVQGLDKREKDDGEAEYQAPERPQQGARPSAGNVRPSQGAKPAPVERQVINADGTVDSIDESVPF